MPELLESQAQADVAAGFQLPIPMKIIQKVIGAILQPCGIVNQFAINELGERIEKRHLTHDQTFDYSEGNSVNH